MAHPLVSQLRFARSEMVRCLRGVSPEEAQERLKPMNCISWIVGHLADQENGYWVRLAQGIQLAHELGELAGWGKPPSTPPMDQMWQVWREITGTADVFLDTIADEDLDRYLEPADQPLAEPVGILLLRNTYHYWFHIGEAHAIRQQLGHQNLPEFVGQMPQMMYRFEE